MLTITINDLHELSKYTNILKSDIKVLTPKGLKKVYAVDITAFNSYVFSIKTKKHTLLCSPDHLIKSNKDWQKTKDFKIGDIIDTKWGFDKVKEISLLDDRRDLLDLHVETNEYYTDDILSHNSSLLDSFDYTLYGKVKGKKKKWSTLSTLPNRINGELQNRIKFSSNGTQIEIKRGINPNTLELWENGILNDRAGKSNLDSKIEDYVGMDIETFKSFISMSVDSFKNFISLSSEEKQLLLDKLFNLEVINILNSILKELNKNNKLRMASLDSEISTLNESIQSIQNSINKSIEKEKENIQSEIDKIKSDMELKKADYISIKEKVDKIKVKYSELVDDLEKEKKQYIILQNDIKNIQGDIDLYDSGKCPTCKTDFDSEHFISLRSTLIEKKKSLEEIKSELENNIRNIKEKQQKLEKISESANKTYNDITYFLKNCKIQIDKLVQKKSKDVGENSHNIEEFKKTIDDLNSKKTSSNDNISRCKDKELYYKEINRIFGEDGVKKSIIAGIIKPINFFINENIKKMSMNFDVSLDETFTAEIKHLGNQIDHDTLSTGEQKKVNVAILIAYLKLIRTKKNINVLFLDEVFSSIDIEGISDILLLLKSFSNEYNINIFVVHHALLNNEHFDRILRINKDIFSTIEEINFETQNEL